MAPVANLAALHREAAEVCAAGRANSLFQQVDDATTRQ